MTLPILLVSVISCLKRLNATPSETMSSLAPHTRISELQVDNTVLHTLMISCLCKTTISYDKLWMHNVTLNVVTITSKDKGMNQNQLAQIFLVKRCDRLHTL